MDWWREKVIAGGIRIGADEKEERIGKMEVDRGGEGDNQTSSTRGRTKMKRGEWKLR